MSEEFVPESGVTSDDRLWATLAYLTPVIPIIIFFLEEKKDRPFIKAHNVQAFIWGLACNLISSVLVSVVFSGCLLWVVYIIISINWAVKANRGEYIEIPVITKFVKDQGWA